jgi:malonyl CoA-acyl carrier protein transacylase
MKHKPRRPRWPASANTMSIATRRAALVTAQDLHTVMAPLKEAMKALREGVATDWQWSMLASSINCAKAIEQQRVVRGLGEHLSSAELALEAVYKRAMATRAWRTTALHWHELDAIQAGIELHEFQLKQLSTGEVIRALDLAQAEVRSSGGKVIHVAAADAAATTENA